MEKLSEKQFKLENALFRKLPETCRIFQLGNYNVRIIDIHFHLPNFKNSPWHMHSYFEAHVIVNGKGEIITNKGSRIFKADELLLTSPNFEHSWSTKDDDLYMYVVSFELKPRNDQQEISDEPIDMVISKLFEVKDFICSCRDIKALLKKIIKEISSCQPGLNHMLACYTKELIVSFARHVNANKEKLNEKLVDNQSDINDQVVILINKYLADNYTNDINLDMIARFVCKSKRSITRHYKKATGTTIIDKLLQMRLFLAEHLLTESDISIKEVAYEVGMSDVSYFCRQFKKFFGCSPSKYRKQNPPKSKTKNANKRNLKKHFDALMP
jgi:AraC-like DNA-binding protein/mannose-6-phosphate isomerase-like protein (cupin superfamily)